MAHWSHTNHLPLQTGKCEFLHFYRKKEPLLNYYYLTGANLKDVQSVKDLGITFTSDLNFSNGIDIISNKAMRKLG